MKKTKRVYTKEFKLETIEIANQRGVAATSRDLEINESVIRRWIKESKSEKFINHSTNQKTNEELLKENQRLQKENFYLKEINNVLKKSTAIFSKDQLPNIK